MNSHGRMRCVLSAREGIPSPVEAEEREVISGEVVREGFVEPLIFELVLELGSIWTGGP